MIRLRKISFLHDIRKNRTPLYYWSLAAGSITTATFITIGYFVYTYRIKKRTKEGIEKGDVEHIINPQGLNSRDLEKAIALFEEQRIHDQIQVDNYERYKKLRNQRREKEGLI